MRGVRADPGDRIVDPGRADRHHPGTDQIGVVGADNADPVGEQVQPQRVEVEAGLRWIDPGVPVDHRRQPHHLDHGLIARHGGEPLRGGGELGVEVWLRVPARRVRGGSTGRRCPGPPCPPPRPPRSRAPVRSWSSSPRWSWSAASPVEAAPTAVVATWSAAAGSPPSLHAVASTRRPTTMHATGRFTTRRYHGSVVDITNPCYRRAAASLRSSARVASPASSRSASARITVARFDPRCSLSLRSTRLK